MEFKASVFRLVLRAGLDSLVSIGIGLGSEECFSLYRYYANFISQ